MKFMPKRSLVDESNPLLNEVSPVLLTIACKGLRETSTKKIVWATLISLLMTPIFWVIPLLSKLLHVVVVVTIWWIVREDIAALGMSEYVVLSLALVIVYYKEVYEEIRDIIAHLVVLLSGGGVLRWVCNGYLSDDGLRERMLDSTLGAAFISGVVVGTMPRAYRSKYDEIMDLYIDSDQENKRERLLQLLDEYSTQYD